MIPAHEGLETGDLVGVDLDDRLVGKCDFLAIKGAPQVRFDLQLVHAGVAEGRSERFDAVSAGALGLVHGQFRVLDEISSGEDCSSTQVTRPIEAVRTISCLAEIDRHQDRLVDAFGESRDLCGVLFGKQDQAELVAADARQRIMGLQQPLEPARHGQQDCVACRYAEFVIDLLEVVDVDGKDRRPDIVLCTCQRDDGVEPVDEELPVRQPREVVVDGVMQEPFLGILLLGDVDQRADAADDFAVGTHHGPRSQRQPVIVAVFGPEPEAGD